MDLDAIQAIAKSPGYEHASVVGDQGVVVRVGLTHQLDGSLHAETLRIGNSEAEFSRVALSKQRQGQQHNSEMRKQAQDCERGESS
jgi:translation initiation factor RLI1